MTILPYIRLHIKIVSRRLHMITPFTFWDMRTLDIQNVCLQTHRNNRIRWKFAYSLREIQTLRVNNSINIEKHLHQKYPFLRSLEKDFKINCWRWSLVPTILDTIPDTVPDKTFGTKQRNLVKVDKTRKVWYILWWAFWQLLPKFDYYYHLSNSSLNHQISSSWYHVQA